MLQTNTLVNKDLLVLAAGKRRCLYLEGRLVVSYTGTNNTASQAGVCFLSGMQSYGTWRANPIGQVNQGFSLDTSTPSRSLGTGSLSEDDVEGQMDCDTSRFLIFFWAWGPPRNAEVTFVKGDTGVIFFVCLLVCFIPFFFLSKKGRG